MEIMSQSLMLSRSTRYLISHNVTPTVFRSNLFSLLQVMLDTHQSILHHAFSQIHLSKHQRKRLFLHEYAALNTRQPALLLRGLFSSTKSFP